MKSTYDTTNRESSESSGESEVFHRRSIGVLGMALGTSILLVAGALTGVASREVLLLLLMASVALCVVGLIDRN